MFWDVLTPSSVVDELLHYTRQMWRMLVEMAGEYGITVPGHHKSEWGPPIVAPPGVSVEMCLDRHAARMMKTRLDKSTYTLKEAGDRLSVFANYGLPIPDEFEREAEGIAFIRRQPEYLTDLDHYLIVLSVESE